MFLVVVLMKWLLGCVCEASWWITIWVCLMSTVVVALSCYSGVGVFDCCYGGLFCCDDISYSLIWLSIFVVGLSLLGSQGVLMREEMAWALLFMVVSLMVSLVVCFSVDSFFVFYVFFEVSLIPTFYIVCGWGYQSERLQASKYLVLYMVVASLPLLVCLVYFFFVGGSSSFVLFRVMEMKSGEILMFFMMNMAFLVKSPVYGVHLWLPKAHVEAPVSGSMLLAGVLLKLGGYGLVRFSWFCVFSCSVVLGGVVCLCLFGGIIASLVCCMQVDAKSLIAYSSVGHMSLVVSGLMCMSYCGLIGSVFLMLAHGLSSCGMFFLVGGLHKLFESRMLYVMRGGVGSLFGVNFWLVLMCGFNSGVPLSLGFCGEIVLYVSLMSYSLLFSVFVGGLSFLSCLYSWTFYCWTQAGNYPIWARSSCLVSGFYVEGVVCWSITFHLVGLCFFSSSLINC